MGRTNNPGRPSFLLTEQMKNFLLELGALKGKSLEARFTFSKLVLVRSLPDRGSPTFTKPEASGMVSQKGTSPRLSITKRFTIGIGSSLQRS